MYSDIEEAMEVTEFSKVSVPEDSEAEEVIGEDSSEAPEVSEVSVEELTEGSTGVTIISIELLSEELSETEGSFEHPVLKSNAAMSTATVIFLKIILSPCLRRHT